MSADPILHGASKEVFAVVYAVCSMKNGPGEVSLSFIERLTGLTRQTIVDCLQLLVAEGYIEKVRAGKRGVSIYMVKKHFPLLTSPASRPVQQVDQSNQQTSLKNRLVKRADQSKELTSDQSSLLTSISQESGPNRNKHKYTRGCDFLFLKNEFDGKSTL